MIQCLGMSHRTAEVALRERFADYETGSVDLLRRTQERLALQGLIILSTCNRVEFYYSSPIPNAMTEERLLMGHGSIEAEIASKTYRMADLQVASHLFRVAAGLDSTVLGEPQILGQVSQAHQAALEAGTAGKVLSRLFQGAIHAGKRARSETGLGKHSTSIPSIAARLASERAAPLSEAYVVLLGAGEMAELAIEALRKRGAKAIQVINRTLTGACELATRWQGEAGSLEELQTAMKLADLMVTSSSAPHALISKDLAKEAMESRPHRPLTIIDIAFPRDVDPEVGDLPGICIFDLDTLDRNLDSGLSARMHEVPKVEAILAEELDHFKEYQRQQKVAPLIVEIRDHAEAIRQRELQRGLKRLDCLSEEQKEKVSILTQSLVNKILHHPTIGLRGAVGNGNFDAYADIAKDLFGLKPDPDADHSDELEVEWQR